MASHSIEPMEALSVDEIPKGAQWQYEPKWDGFRCLLTRDGKSVTMTSKSGQDLTRYFPEVAQAAVTMSEKTAQGQRFVLDGELVIPLEGQFSFDALLQRIHPAASRIARLSVETPALFLVFDLLAVGAEDLRAKFLPQRRRALEKFAARHFGKTLLRLSAASTQLKDAEKWLKLAGGGSDGVIAKRVDLPYQSGNRAGMQKIKCYRSADCVIGGFRYGEGRKVVGSLLLGLYDDEGLLNHVGFTSGLKAKEKPALTKRLEELITTTSFTGSKPGGPSRWSTKRSSQWQPIKPKLVVEVSYDHFSGGRFRHGTAILRWRPDKRPQQCTLDQLKQKQLNVQTLLSGSF